MNYKEDLALKIATYTPMQLVGLLYEAIEENSMYMKKCIKEKNIQEAIKTHNHNLEIISHLISTLGTGNPEFEIVSKHLYLIMVEQSTDAIVKEKPELLEKVIKIADRLKNSWFEASEKIQIPQKTQNYGNIYTKDGINYNVSINKWGRG